MLKLSYFREHSPSIIFMDEIDSIGSSRIESSGSGGGKKMHYILQAVLVNLLLRTMAILENS